MNHSQRQILFSRAVRHVSEATGISRRNDIHFCRFDVLQLSVEKFVRHFRLNQIVDSGAAATPGAFGKFRQLQIGNRFQKLAWLRGDFLAVTKMTRFVIGHILRRKIFIGRRLDSDLREPFVNVFYFLIPKMRAFLIRRILGQKFRVMFQMRTAARRVRDDGVELFRRELIDVPARQPLRHFPFAIVRVQ